MGMNVVGKKPLLFLCAYGLFQAAALAGDGKPFIHPFGELRVYHQDWLVVCENKGKGVCRMVNMKLDKKKDHFFGNSELTIYPAAQGLRESSVVGYKNAAVIEFFKRDMAKLEGMVSVEVDGKTIAEFKPNDGVFDSSSQKNLALETYGFEGDAVKRILAAIPHGKRLKISYRQNDRQATEAFSLRGAAESLAFIRDIVRASPRG